MKVKLILLLLLGFTVIMSCDTEDDEPAPTYFLTRIASPTDGGKISVSPPSANYNHGQEVTLTPEANANWVFQKWEGDASGNSVPLKLTMDADKSVTAVFVKRDYPLTISIEGEGTVNEVVVTNPGGREYPHGTTVELTPLAKDGWKFDSWGGNLSGNDVPIRIVVDGEKNVVVRFNEKDATPPVRTKNLFGQPYTPPSCRLVEGYDEGSESVTTIFNYYDNGVLKNMIEVENGIGVDTSVVVYRSDGLIDYVKEYFNTITMDYDSQDRLMRVFVEHNSSGHRDTTEITYIGDKTVKISQRQFGKPAGDFVHEFDDKYNLVRTVLYNPYTGQPVEETNTDFHSGTNNFWLSLGDFRFHILLAGDWSGVYPYVASSEMMKYMSHTEHYENPPRNREFMVEVLSVNSQRFPTKILGMDDGVTTIIEYKCQ
ncbi:hypothetical protein GCM10009119_10840 [Algoriphagus jejuensis]|uniref:Bacterial repeat domain-containing protein n=1 Tax=Algoriphagus jejuensis TaxID=419934 RepID=A0ABP3Y9H9_9BACT